MIKYFLAAFLLLSTTELFAQFNLFTVLRSDYTYNENSRKYDLLSSDDKVVTLFEFNSDLTKFVHTTPTITSTYTINHFMKDQRTGQYEFKVTSDAGNKYDIEYDVEGKLIKIYGVSSGSKFMVTHKIRRAWVIQDK